GLIVNSTGNRIYNNTLLGNPVDLSCQYNSGYRTFNKFGNTTCYVNDYCNFATCTQINLQETPQLVVLHGVINSCGDIEQQGTYVLSSNLNMENYINTSQQSTFPCLTVSVSNVHINCNGYAISNSNFGIFSANQLNVSVSDCKLNNNKYGIYLLGALRFGLTGITGNGNTYGLYLYNSTLGNLTDISMRSGTYGIYLNRSTFISLANVTSKQNTYGAFMDNSSTLTLSSSTYANNSKDDLFCQANDYNTTTSSLSASQCGRTDCSWATQCAVHTLPQLVAVGISSCTTITVPGPYVLTANPIYQGNGDCIKIASGNVTISCSNHTINGFGTGTGIYANGVSNIGLSQCKFRSLSQGAVIQNSSSDTVQNIWMDSVHSGLSFVNTPDLVLSNSTIYNYSSFAYSFNSLNRSTVVYDNATHGIGNTTSAGFAFVKAFNNTIENDTASSGSGYGFNFQTVKNNIIKNNTGNGNNVDFICSPDSSGLYADRGNLNYGLDKIGCKWLVAVPPTSLLQIQCVLLNSPSQISLKYDAWYPFGNTCYSVISNATNHATNTQINCNGHTIFAVNAGTFARVVNTSAVTIENCVLYGFNTAINATSKTPQTNLDLINDTIGNTTTAISSTNYQSTIRNNYITNSTYGIVLSVANSSQLQNNLIANVNNGITISKTSTVSIINDTTSGGFGVSLYNASSVSLQSSNLHGSSSGLYCSTSSAPKSSFSTDMGGNSCSSTNCLWVTSASCPYNASSGTSKQSFSSASSPKAKQTFPSGSCYVSRSGKPAFAGTCNNATPIYVAMLTNGTTISSSGSSNSSTKQYSVASWFYLSKPYHNSSDNVTLNFSANKWYSLVTALNYTNINKENENVYVNGNYLLTAKRIQLFALLEFAVNADYKYISNYQYYNSSITQQQAARIYSEGLGGAPANLSSLTGWFPLNDNTLDYSGRNQNFAYSGLAFTKSFTPP
ncbi:MAG: right-handed parallel beta-helix repeat-containing protein, partial [Candidatus Micrarchaeota archaeon]|nr:right-handed parallel beta-helix repeat-containing protein [Candidatus Micrarchaeota archaeon]